MCVANLNVSLQPCEHRWYTLLRPCSPSTSLSNCSERLKLEGWETRNEHCPWCTSNRSSVEVHDSTHRLFGSMSERSNFSNSTASGYARRSRANSASATLDKVSRSSRSSSRSSDCVDADALGHGERTRMMNARLETYLWTNPGQVLQGKAEERGRSDGDDRGFVAASVGRRSSVLGKPWKKSMKLSRGILRG